MRLISFLGVENYSETTYTSPDLPGQRTQFVCHALAAWYKPLSIHVLATEQAADKHRESLVSCLEAHKLPRPDFVPVPRGGSQDELRDLFTKLVASIKSASGEVLIDITNGLRMHPFFAAACIQYVQAVLPAPPKMRVVYADFRREETQSPIWELTPFLEVLSWSRSLMMFLRTGQADEVVAPTEALGRELSRRWATSGRQGTQPQLRALAQALSAFGADFTTIRTGSLLIGSEPSAQELWNAIERTRDEVAQQLPALALVLDQVQAMVAPLRTGGARLSSADGQRVLLALARLYQMMGRYSEAISVLREGWITLGAPPTCDMPGTDFDREARSTQEQTWQTSTTQARSVSELRNDIQHAGFNQQPHDRTWFEKQLTILLNHWQAAIDSMADRHSE
jgi:CRISPR-associated protein Csx16